MASSSWHMLYPKNRILFSKAYWARYLPAFLSKQTPRYTDVGNLFSFFSAATVTVAFTFADIAPGLNTTPTPAHVNPFPWLKIVYSSLHREWQRGCRVGPRRHAKSLSNFVWEKIYRRGCTCWHQHYSPVEILFIAVFDREYLQVDFVLSHRKVKQFFQKKKRVMNEQYVRLLHLSCVCVSLSLSHTHTHTMYLDDRRVEPHLKWL